MNKLFKLGQTLVEYAVVLACVIIALTVMGVYVKRGLSGGLRNSADSLGRQYDPLAISASITTTATGVSVSTTIRNTEEDGKVYSDTYTVTGPVAAYDTAGNVVIPADDTRNPEVTTSTGTETVTPDSDGKILTSG